MRDNENLILPEVVLRQRAPRALFAREAPDLPRPVRIAIGALLLALHGVALWAIARLDARDDGLQATDTALVVSFIARPERERDETETIVVPMTSPSPPHHPERPAGTAAGASSAREQKRAGGTANGAIAPHGAEDLRDALYGADGRVRLPQATLDAMAKVDGGNREFSYQVPGLERADKLLEQRPVIEYRATRFDKMYRPTQDVLTDLLTRMVEATTREVRIPAPGNPKATIVCRISVLALGGGCGIEDGDGWMPSGDDPNTLSPEEDRACQAWWDKIVAATTQDAWRKTRVLYEAQCRKPLERKPPQPPLPADAAVRH